MPDKPWSGLTKPEAITVVAPDGSVRWEGVGHFSGGLLVVDEPKADIRPGDEVRRRLPNGNDDTWQADNPVFYDGHFGPHYQVKLSRKGTFDHGRGGHFNITVSGANSRINVGSTDNSTNFVTSGDLFADIRRAVEVGVADVAKRAEIIARVNDAEGAKGTPRFLATYQALIGTVADHLGVLTPFMPALTQLLG